MTSKLQLEKDFTAKVYGDFIKLCLCWYDLRVEGANVKKISKMIIDYVESTHRYIHQYQVIKSKGLSNDRNPPLRSSSKRSSKTKSKSDRVCRRKVSDRKRKDDCKKDCSSTGWRKKVVQSFELQKKDAKR